jgi:hypothetical protein
MNRVGFRALLIVLLLVTGLAFDASQATGSERPTRRGRTPF